ncbi:cytochrome P450 [Gordonia aurantiaca]|uniref:cytochrome P450 n=1 Tax=Gordonia sp. B21 TaxID=3151852 RepID=UPI003262FCDF
MYPRCADIVRAEVGNLLVECFDGRLTWDAYAIAHWRMLRRLVFGDAARDQEDVTDVLTEFRHEANWAYAFPPRNGRSARFRRRLDELVFAAPTDSLAGTIRDAPVAGRDEIDPTGQIPQWLFAFDAVAVAILRAPALLAAHPDALGGARADIDDLDAGRSARLPNLRAALLESLRLWPTTLAILREAIRDVHWTGGVIPSGTTTVVLGEHFQRDDDAMDFARRFAPEAWLDGRALGLAGVVPFADGPGECPGRNVVMLFGSLVPAEICRDHEPSDDVLTPLVSGGAELPRSLNHFDLAIRLTKK